jgi:parallel beta-helix repeat protein
MTTSPSVVRRLVSGLAPTPARDEVLTPRRAEPPSEDLTVHHWPAKPPRRSQWLLGGLVAVLLAVGVAFALSPGSGKVAQVRVSTGADGERISLANGGITIGQLHDALRRDGHGALLTPVPGGGYELNASVFATAGATLSVSNTALLLHSDVHQQVTIVAQGGLVDLSRDTVTSWGDANAPDTDVSDGRSDLLAQGSGSSLILDHSTIAALGSATDGAAVVWRSGALGAATDTTFTSDYQGAFADQSGQVVIEGSSFARSEKTGLMLLDPGAGTAVSGSSFSNNAANGLEIDGGIGTVVSNMTASGNAFNGLALTGGTGVQVSGGSLSNSKDYGILATNVQRLSVSGVRSWANLTGAEIDGGTGVITGSFFSGNVNDGVFVTGPATALRLAGNRFDNNERAGFWIAGGTVTASGNQVDLNRTGISDVEIADQSTISNNLISASFLDGISLARPTTGVVSGNTISGSAKAAFSFALKGDSSAVVTANHVLPGQPVTRIMGS